MYYSFQSAGIAHILSYCLVASWWQVNSMFNDFFSVSNTFYLHIKTFHIHIFKDFLFKFGFDKLDYYVHVHRFLHIYTVWCLLRFLKHKYTTFKNLRDYLAITFSCYIRLFLPPFGNSNIHMLDLFYIVPWVSEPLSITF